MNALIWKDMFLMRNGLLYIAVFAVVFSAIFNDAGVMCIVSSVIFSSVANSSISMDDMCRWDVFATSSGISRKAIVRSKFMVGLVFVLIGTVIGMAMSLMIGTYSGNMDLPGTIQMGATGFVLAYLVNSLNIAVTYYTGDSTKSQYVSMVVMILSIVVLVSTTLIASEVLDNMVPILAVLIVACAAMVMGSYKVSCARYASRDL